MEESKKCRRTVTRNAYQGTAFLSIHRTRKNVDKPNKSQSRILSKLPKHDNYEGHLL